MTEPRSPVPADDPGDNPTSPVDNTGADYYLPDDPETVDLPDPPPPPPPPPTNTPAGDASP